MTFAVCFPSHFSRIFSILSFAKNVTWRLSLLPNRMRRILTLLYAEVLSRINANRGKLELFFSETFICFYSFVGKEKYNATRVAYSVRETWNLKEPGNSIDFGTLIILIMCTFEGKMALTYRIGLIATNAQMPSPERSMTTKQEGLAWDPGKPGKLPRSRYEITLLFFLKKMECLIDYLYNVGEEVECLKFKRKDWLLVSSLLVKLLCSRSLNTKRSQTSSSRFHQFY